MSPRRTEGCLAVIPARGGSKRVPDKNIRTLGGRPLIAHTIAAALESGLFARVVVTTDSPAIADVARACGAEVPFMRSAELADDHTPVSAATVDALQRLDPRRSVYDAVCQLMPNCPLRLASDIIGSRDQFVRTGAGSQLSVVRYGWLNPWWAMRRNDRLVIEPLFEQQLKQRSQDLPELFCPTGAVWWASASYLRRHGGFDGPGRTGWELAWQRGVDIDTIEDFALAELLLAASRRDAPREPGGAGVN